MSESDAMSLAAANGELTNAGDWLDVVGRTLDKILNESDHLATMQKVSRATTHLRTARMAVRMTLKAIEQ